jgi:hypothetical protein
MVVLTQSERRLKMLKTEVDLDFPTLLKDLEGGMKIVVVTENHLTSSSEPDHLRRVGGMVAVCNHYGAAVVFVSEKAITCFGGSTMSGS